MKNFKFNFEWVVPVIVFAVFVIGNIMRILNWKNEQDKKAIRRPREFQNPRRQTVTQSVRESDTPLVVEAVFPSVAQRQLNAPPRPGGRLESVQAASRQNPQAASMSDEVQRAIRRNRAKAQKKVNGARAIVVETVVPVVTSVGPRQTRDDVPNVPAVVLPEGGAPSSSAQAMSTLVAELFTSPEAMAKAMVLQIILSPPLCRRQPQGSS